MSQKTSGSFNEARNGSADSGQSSSPDASCSNVSLADSLENQTISGHHQAVDSSAGIVAAQQEPQKGDKLSRGTLDYDDAQTIRNYQEAAALANNKISTNNNNNNNNNDIIEATTPTATKQEATAGNGELEQASIVVAKQPFARLPLTSNNYLETPSPASNDRQQQEEEEQDTIMKQPPQKNAVGNTNNNNNNYSGLNLNMTAAEMRELIARRKKFDPKKAQMNIRQKYEIIQQM